VSTAQAVIRATDDKMPTVLPSDGPQPASPRARTGLRPDCIVDLSIPDASGSLTYMTHSDES
jgi:hypothetical protein